jgi:hypothetical protein
MKYTRLPRGWLHQLNLLILTSYHGIPGIVDSASSASTFLRQIWAHVLLTCLWLYLICHYHNHSNEVTAFTVHLTSHFSLLFVPLPQGTLNQTLQLNPHRLQQKEPNVQPRPSLAP